MHLILIFSQLYRVIRVMDHEAYGIWLIFMSQVIPSPVTALYINNMKAYGPGIETF